MSNIQPGHVHAFQAVRSQRYTNITLASCQINGEPGVAMVMTEHLGQGKIAVIPLFVAITPSMELVFAGALPGSAGQAKEVFTADKAMSTSEPE